MHAHRLLSFLITFPKCVSIMPTNACTTAAFVLFQWLELKFKTQSVWPVWVCLQKANVTREPVSARVFCYLSQCKLLIVCLKEELTVVSKRHRFRRLSFVKGIVPVTERIVAS